MRRAGFLLVVLALAAASCYGSDSNLSESGKGKPTLTIEFPASVKPGATEDLVLEISNPGPGGIPSLFVAFANVGVPGSGLGNELVPFSTSEENPAVADVSPEPESVSQDGVVYRFGELEAGAATRITFSIVVPRVRGPAASSVQVYDGNELDRATGKRVATTVEG